PFVFHQHTSADRYSLSLHAALPIFDLEAVARYDKILISPGPGLPDEAGIMKALIRQYAPTKSILGICLGHQGIGEVFGARLFNRSEEHTSELQSRENLVCRLLLEKK